MIPSRITEPQEEIKAFIAQLSSKRKEIQRVASASLANLALNPENSALIGQAGGIPPLIALLSDEDAEIQKTAGNALANLTVDDENKILIGRTGGILPLIDLLSHEDTEIQKIASTALRNLAVSAENSAAIGRARGIRPLVTLLSQEDTEIQKMASTALANLAVNAENKIAIRKFGGIPYLITLLRHKNTEIRKAALGALQNLATDNESKITIRQAEGIPPLIELLFPKYQEDREIQRMATAAVANLAADSENRSVIGQAGGIPPLVDLLSQTYQEDREIQRFASAALANLSLNNENKIAIQKSSGIAPLVTLLSKQDLKIQIAATGAIKHLALLPSNKKMIASAGGIQALIIMLRHPDPMIVEQAATALWYLAYDDGSNKKIIAETTLGIPALIEALNTHSQSPEILKAATGAIKHLAHLPSNKKMIASAGAVPLLITMLKHSDPMIVEQAATALWYLAYDDGSNKKIIAEASGIPSLIEVLRTYSRFPEILKAATGAIKHLALLPSNKKMIASAGAIPLLITMLKHPDPTIVEQAATALWYLAYDDGSNKKMIASAGAIPLLITMLKHPDPMIVEQAATALRHLAYDDGSNKKIIAEASGIPALIEVLRTYSGFPEIFKAATSAIKELALLPNNKKIIASTDAIPLLITMLKHPDPMIVEQAATALWYLAYDDGSNKKIIAEASGIPALIEVLDTHSQSPEILRAATGAIKHLALLPSNKKMIAESIGIERLKKLVKHDDMRIVSNTVEAIAYLSTSSLSKKILELEDESWITILTTLMLKHENTEISHHIYGIFKNLETKKTVRQSIQTLIANLHKEQSTPYQTPVISYEGTAWSVIYAYAPGTTLTIQQASLDQPIILEHSNQKTKYVKEIARLQSSECTPWRMKIAEDFEHLSHKDQVVLTPDSLVAFRQALFSLRDTRPEKFFLWLPYQLFRAIRDIHIQHASAYSALDIVLEMSSSKENIEELMDRNQQSSHETQIVEPIANEEEIIEEGNGDPKEDATDRPIKIIRAKLLGKNAQSLYTQEVEKLAVPSSPLIQSYERYLCSHLESLTFDNALNDGSIEACEDTEVERLLSLIDFRRLTLKKLEFKNNTCSWRSLWNFLKAEHINLHLEHLSIHHTSLDADSFRDIQHVFGSKLNPRFSALKTLELNIAPELRTIFLNIHHDLCLPVLEQMLLHPSLANDETQGLVASMRQTHFFGFQRHECSTLWENSTIAEQSLRKNKNIFEIYERLRSKSRGTLIRTLNFYAGHHTQSLFLLKEQIHIAYSLDIFYDPWEIHVLSQKPDVHTLKTAAPGGYPLTSDALACLFRFLASTPCSDYPFQCLKKLTWEHEERVHETDEARASFVDFIHTRSLRLSELRFKGHPPTVCFAYAERHSFLSLRRLELDDCDLNEPQLGLLAFYLSHTETEKPYLLESLSLQDNAFDARSFLLFLGTLNSLKKLQALYAGPFSNTYPDDGPLEDIEHALRHSAQRLPKLSIFSAPNLFRTQSKSHDFFKKKATLPSIQIIKVTHTIEEDVQNLQQQPLEKLSNSLKRLSIT